MLRNIKIALLDDTQRIWFVRSSSGTYAPHFKSGKLIATDYLSEIFDEANLKDLPSRDLIRSAIISKEKFSEFRFNKQENKEVKTLNGSGAKLQAAINKFKEEILLGDLVITKTSSGGFMFGICSADEAYVSSEPVKLPASELEGATYQDKIKLKYSLRKNVVWGPTIRESEIPDALKNSLARNTLTEVTHLKEMVYHLLYPFFTDGKNLYFSNKIRSSEAINSAVIGKLFQNISLVTPLASAILSNTDINPAELIREVETSIFSNIILSTSKADFMSPGDTWSTIPLLGSISPKQLAAVALSCLLVTGIINVYEMEAAFATSALQQIEDNDSSTPASAHKTPGTDSSLFNDKFKDGDTTTSPELEKIKESINRQREAINELSDKTYAKVINKSLQLELLQPNTASLENLEFGIKLQKLGSN